MSHPKHPLSALKGRPNKEGSATGKGATVLYGATTNGDNVISKINGGDTLGPYGQLI
jgi:hypothetical protein